MKACCSMTSSAKGSLSIWSFCFGYFLFYIPYSMLTKMLSSGLLPGMNGQGLGSFKIQPATAFGSFASMYIFFTISGWWKYATHSRILGIELPRPQWFTFLSGICTSAIILTTTLAYTFKGISIAFAMLLMRGGVLVAAPIVDLIVKTRKRKIYWPSWVGAILSFIALLIGISSKTSAEITLAAAVNIIVYVLSYFIRFIFMGSKAKSSDEVEKKRYFVEEQMVANPILFFSLLFVALAGRNMPPESIPAALWAGFAELPKTQYIVYALLAGFFSYCIGLFGNLIYLDEREHTFCVPANRSASVIAGITATYLLAIFWGQKYPESRELIGLGLILTAIVFLAYRSIMDKRPKAVQENE